VAIAVFGFRSFGSRFLFAFAMVVLTWNPTRFNYVAWALAQWQNLAPIIVFVGLALAAGWFFFLSSTGRALGPWGLIVCGGLAATILWGLYRYDILDSENTTVLSWILLVLFSLILATGMSWAHLRSRWSGQATVDEIDEK
jgi:hypothetical protein